MQVGTNRSRGPVTVKRRLLRATTLSPSHYTELQERNSLCDRYCRGSGWNLNIVKCGWIISISPSFHCYIQLQASLRQSCFPYKNLQEMQEMGEIRGNTLYILFTQLILLKSVELFAYIWQMILKSFLMPLAWHEYTNLSLLTLKNYNPQVLKKNQDIICLDVSIPKGCSAVFSRSLLAPSNGLTKPYSTVSVRLKHSTRNTVGFTEGRWRRKIQSFSAFFW